MVYVNIPKLMIIILSCDEIHPKCMNWDIWKRTKCSWNSFDGFPSLKDDMTDINFYLHSSLFLSLFSSSFPTLSCLTFYIWGLGFISHIVIGCPLAGLYLFLLRYPAGCANYCNYLCQYINLGSFASFCKSDHSHPYSLMHWHVLICLIHLM